MGTIEEDEKGELPREGLVAWPPHHPGAELREIVLPALSMSVAKAAALMRVSEQTLHAVLAEKHAVTPEMALRIGKFCGNGPGTWLRMQQEHDLWLAAQDIEEELELIPTMRLRRRKSRSAEESSG